MINLSWWVFLINTTKSLWTKIRNSILHKKNLEFFTIRSLCSIARPLQVQSSQLLESCVNPRWIWMIGLLCLLGKMVVFIGARGPLNNQPYITWVFIGFQIPLQKRDPTRGRFKQLGALRLKGTSLKVFRKNPRGLGGSYHKKSRCISRHRGFFISEKW